MGNTLAYLGNIRGPQGVQGPQGLPGTGAVPADDAVAGYLGTEGTSATQTAADSRYGRRRMYDVRNYLSAGDFGAAVNAAIADAYADSAGFGRPGQVVLPPGAFALTTEITWLLAGGVSAHGVDLIGSDRGTALIPQGSIAALHHISPSGGEALSDVLIANLEIDGSDQVNPAGGYVTSVKGTYMQRLRRVTLENLYIHDTIATGLGNDFHDACTIRNVVAENCGRGNSGTNGGGAGIGIGTGVWVTEALIVEGCTTRGNKRNGLFFETQSGLWPVGTRVVGHYSERNGGHGIADAGLTGLVVEGGLSRLNGGAGFAADAGTIAPAAPGIRGLVSGLDLTENTGAGILIETSTRQVPATQTGYELDGTEVTITTVETGYTFRGCNVRQNQSDGVRVNTGGTETLLDGLTLSDLDIMGNRENGINLNTFATTGSKNVTIQGSRIRNNGTDTAASDNARVGVRIGAPVDGLRLVGNRITDTRAAGSKTQKYGIRVGAALTGYCELDNNDVRGNDLGGVSINTTAGTYAADVSLGFNPGWTVISGTPEGTVQAPKGALVRRIDGADATQVLYVKTTATGNTGWVAK